MPTTKNCITAAVLVATFGFAGVAQAEPLNIWSASQQQSASHETAKIETVRHGGRHHHHHRRYHRHRHGINPGLAAVGVIGAIAAGAAIANQDRYYYDDDYYYDEGPGPRYYRDDDYCANNGGKPSHYPAPPGC